MTHATDNNPPKDKEDVEGQWYAKCLRKFPWRWGEETFPLILKTRRLMYTYNTEIIMASEVHLISPLSSIFFANIFFSVWPCISVIITYAFAYFLLLCRFDSYILAFPTAGFPHDVFLTLPLHPLLANDSGFTVAASGLVGVAAADVAVVVAAVTVVAAVMAWLKPTGMHFS